MAAAAALITDVQATAPAPFDIVLRPITHLDLAEIRIKDDLFAIGRAEPPFDSYPADVVAGLSRRHARIFVEDGAAYIADFNSTNGTNLNGVHVREKPCRLRDGDELCLGGTLSYGVQLEPRAKTPLSSERLLSLTLAPVRTDAGLQPIVLTRFPFLIGKSDTTFARYQDKYPHEVSYISRRHAHIFLKSGTLFVEDLGSRNGTFVGGRRLTEHAVPLEDGEVVGFGGNHFLYKVSVEKVVEEETTLTKVASIVRAAPVAEAADSERTTFVTSAASFLDIFCVDQASQPPDEFDGGAAREPVAEAEVRAPRGKFATLLAALTTAFAGSERASVQRFVWWGSAAVAVLALFALTIHIWGASEREVKDLYARGEYAKAAAAANDYLERHPESAEIKALGTEALLKQHVPQWLALLETGDFDRARAALVDVKRLGAHNADLQSFVSELEWIGDLQEYIIGRGGVDAPVRIYADEEKIRLLVKRWNEDTQRHQRAFATISSYVPAFDGAYAEALSRVRKLQNDDSVYLAAIERLKATIDIELERDSQAALEPILKEYAEKYPRLSGLDGLRRDLRQYLEVVESEGRERRLGRSIALLTNVRFSTPPFQSKFRAAASSDRFPPAAVVEQYAVVFEAWRQGDAKQALAELQKMVAGPWSDATSRELQHKRAIVDQYTALQRSRGTTGYEERLLAFYAELDPYEDVYFMRAIEADVGQYRDGALTRAREALERAETLWRQYREKGPIDGRQRLKAPISNEFRTQAQLLSDAHESAQRGMRIYTQSKATPPAQWNNAQEDIAAELEIQRKALLDLRHVLEPGLLKAKLALLK